jgi:heavy metal sensor kinase
MNTRSLKFRLIAWYAGLLAGGFILLGGVTYVVLQSFLVGSLSDSQMRRARQIGQLLSEELQHQRESRIGEEIETRYAPGLNERFVRVSLTNGVVLYTSGAPKDQNFDPAAIAPPAWSAQSETVRQEALANGRKILLAAHVVRSPRGAVYLVEAGAPMDEVQADLRQWLLFLAMGLPIVMAIALGGGGWLVKRALSPVDQITASAERITSHSLSERLPIAQTGDELERLSLALNRMIERLDTAFQHSRRFVADASHELRTPLTVLRGEIESMLQESRLDSVWREQLGSALEEVERLSNIVEGLFAISRLDAGEAAAEWKPFDLAALTSATADQMGLLAEDKNIELNCKATMSAWVEGDRARVKQVVVNLLDNAIKYSRPGGAITLKVESTDGKAVLEVADNGMGIPPEALSRVFDRFYRVDQARSREQGGAGLGLSIVKSICAAHQGTVTATSTPGRGSIFRVELPLVVAATSNGNHKS